MKSKLARSLEILRTEGPRALWFKFLGEIVYRRLDVIERRVDPAAGSPDPGTGLVISLLQPAGIDEFLAFRSFVDRDTVRTRLGRGQVCFLVRANGRIVHNVWVATGRVTIDYLDCDIQVADDTLYVFEAYTAPEFRGRSISSIRSRALEKYCAAHGFTRLLAAVLPENPPVYRSFAKAGYVMSGRTGYLGFGRFKRHFCRYRGDDPPFRLLGRPGTDRPGATTR